MPKRALLVTFCLVTSSFAVRVRGSTYSDGVLALNPQAYWELNDTSQDGIDQVGSYPGNDPIVTVESGVSRGAAGPSAATYPGLGSNDLSWSFQTGTGAQTLNYIPATGDAPRTITGWMKLDATPDAQGGEVSFISYGASTTGSNTGTAFNMDVQDGFNSSTGQPLGYDVFALNISGREVEATTTPIATGVWYMYTAVVPNGATTLGQTQLYIDGVSQTLINDTVAPLNTAPASQAPVSFRLGRDYGGYGFQGELNNVSAWNSALTSIQIQNLYQSALTNEPPGVPPLLTPITPAAVPWTVTPLKGQSQFVFASIAPPDDSYTDLVAAITNAQQTQMGNGIDPFYSPETYDTPDYQYIAQLGLWINAYPAGGQQVYTVGASGLTASEQSVVAITDKPGAPTPVEFGEWDNEFLNIQGIGTGYSPTPTTKQQAYNELNAYYTARQTAYGGRLFAEAGLSNFEPYEAEWGTQAIGMELGENILSSQVKMAMARGASRQYATPWTVDVSPWFAGTETTAGPLTGGDGNARGIDAGHSESLYNRLWYHAWFAGASEVTPEGGGAYLYNNGGAAPYSETTLGVDANNYYKFTLTHDRGVAYTPVAIVLDNLAGYDATTDKPWGVLNPTTGDTEIDDLFKYQFFPGSGASNAPNAPNPEAPYLVSTPYGEMYDIILSNASTSTLSAYADIVLAGDINFTSSFISQLQGALQHGSKLLISQAQSTALGSSNLALLRSAGSVQVMSPSTVPETGRPAVISDQELGTLNSTLMPLAVTGSPVEYEINKNNEGWVLELINDNGVTKIPWEPAVIDPNQTADVTIQSRLAGNWAAFDWQTGQSIAYTSTYWSTSVGPGALQYIQFLPELTWNNAGAGSPADGITWDTTSNNWNNGAAATSYTDGAIVTFNDANNGNYSVTLNGTVQPTSLTFGNAGNYTINGTGHIGGTGTLTKSGSGTVILTTTNTYTGGTTIDAGTLVVGVNGALPANAINVAGGTLELGPGTGKFEVQMSSLAISQNATLDITNNHVILDYNSGSDPIASIVSLIESGYAGGSWTGTGITSSAARANAGSYGIGYADAADRGNPTRLAPGKIELMYTLLGDANLDGKVNGTDFEIMAMNFNQSGESWDEGDFNYDGKVNGSDFLLLANNFNQFASQSSVNDSDLIALDSFAQSMGISLTSVPEPACGTLVLITGIFGMTARRKKRTGEEYGSHEQPSARSANLF